MTTDDAVFFERIAQMITQVRDLCSNMCDGRELLSQPLANQPPHPLWQLLVIKGGPGASTTAKATAVLQMVVVADPATFAPAPRIRWSNQPAAGHEQKSPLPQGALGEGASVGERKASLYSYSVDITEIESPPNEHEPASKERDTQPSRDASRRA